MKWGVLRHSRRYTSPVEPTGTSLSEAPLLREVPRTRLPVGYLGLLACSLPAGFLSLLFVESFPLEGSSERERIVTMTAPSALRRVLPREWLRVPVGLVSDVPFLVPALGTARLFQRRLGVLRHGHDFLSSPFIS